MTPHFAGHVKSAAIKTANNNGWTVTLDGSHAVLASRSTNQLVVYSLPGFTEVRAVGVAGGAGGVIDLNSPVAVCPSSRGTLFVADKGNNRIVEATLEGQQVKLIGADKFGDGCPVAVAVHGEHLLVAKEGGSAAKLVLFNEASGAFVREFCASGAADGQLGANIGGLRMAADGANINVYVSDDTNGRVSVLKLADGGFVTKIGHGELGIGGSCQMDVEVDVNGDVVVADYAKHRVCVFGKAAGYRLVRTIGCSAAGNNDWQFNGPTSLCIRQERLYVMNHASPRVQVFGVPY